MPVTGVPFFVTETLAPEKVALADCTDQAVSWVELLINLSSSGAGKNPADGQGIISGLLAALFLDPVLITYNV